MKNLPDNTEITFRHYAGPNERFSPDVEETMIGQSFTAKVEDQTVGDGLVVGARVVEDGRAIELTVKWP